MKKFTNSEPYIYPKNYKDKEAKDIKKWFIRYTIKYKVTPTHLDNSDLVQYRKEYGKAYKIEVNSIDSITEKRTKIENLLDWVQYDLINGIDPINRDVEREEQIKKEVLEAEKYQLQYVFDLWFASKNYVNPIPSKVLSAQKYKGFWKNQFIPYLKSLGKDGDIRKVTNDDITNWLTENYNSGKWSAFTCNIKIGFMSGVFKYAFKAKLITENPMTYVSQVKENKIIVKDGVATIKRRKQTRFNIFTDSELKTVFEKIYNTQDEAIAKTIHFAFIRFSEIFRLKLEHLDLENNCFNIPPEIAKGQSGGETLKVKIYPILKDALVRYINKHFVDDKNPDYYLFYHLEKNVPSSYSIFQKRFYDMKDGLDFELNKTPYAFKHTGAKRFIDQNKAKSKTSYEIIEAIMKLMRHSNFNTSQKYIYKDLGINLDENDDFTFD